MKQAKTKSGIFVQIQFRSRPDARPRASSSVVHFVHDNKKPNNS